jgi:hypothetical protein
MDAREHLTFPAAVVLLVMFAAMLGAAHLWVQHLATWEPHQVNASADVLMPGGACDPQLSPFLSSADQEWRCVEGRWVTP